jgi:hypothetical protein
VNRRKIIPVVTVTKAVLAQTCMGVFFIRSVSDTMFAVILLPKPPADHSLKHTAVQFVLNARLHKQMFCDVRYCIINTRIHGFRCSVFYICINLWNESRMCSSYHRSTKTNVHFLYTRRSVSLTRVCAVSCVGTTVDRERYDRVMAILGTTHFHC